jgi:putative ABC transport system permease protein
MRNLSQYLRYAGRSLIKTPGYSLAVVLTLALGTGVNSAIFSLVDSVLLRPLPYRDAGRLVMIWETSKADPAAKLPTAVADLADWQEQNRVFSRLGAYHNWSFSITGQGDAERVPGGVVTANFFGLLGVSPVVGRDFRPDEQGPAAQPVVILSYGLWQRRFGADPRVLGAKLTLNDKVWTVVGVMPPGFEFPDLAQMWTPLAHGRDLEHRDFQFLRVVGRLRPGVSRARAQQDMSAIAGRLARQYPDTNGGRGVLLVPMREQLAGDLRPAMLVLSCTVLLILAIACANIISLTLARAAARRDELAVRSALGAGRRLLVLQQTLESLLLALLGGGLGLLVAGAALRYLTLLAPDALPWFAKPAIDGRALAFTLSVSIGAGLLVGILPALQASRPQLLELLKAAAGRQRGGGARVRGVLVVLEIGMATMLLVGAGLLVQSFAHLRGVDPGFTATRALTGQITLPEDRYPGLAQTSGFLRDLLERLDHLPGVEAATAAMTLPLAKKGMSVDTTYTIDGLPPPPPGEHQIGFLRPVSPDYFRVMGVRVRAGRSFTDRDDASAAPVVMINETLARRYWPRGDAVGRRLTVGVDLGDLGNAKTVSREIVGVVGDVKHTGLDAPAQPEIYVSMRQTPWRIFLLVVRSTTPPEMLAKMVANQVWAIDRNLPLYRVRTLEQMIADSIARPALYGTLLAAFAGLALLLAAVGIYGLVSYLVNERRREIGIRMALGAARRDVMRLVVGRVLILALSGTALGLAASLALSRLLASLLFGVAGRDLPTLSLAALTLGVIGTIAGYLPARRAARTEPVAVLRAE